MSVETKGSAIIRGSSLPKLGEVLPDGTMWKLYMRSDGKAVLRREIAVPRVVPLRQVSPISSRRSSIIRAGDAAMAQVRPAVFRQIPAEVYKQAPLPLFAKVELKPVETNQARFAKADLQQVEAEPVAAVSVEPKREEIVPVEQPSRVEPVMQNTKPAAKEAITVPFMPIPEPVLSVAVIQAKTAYEEATRPSVMVRDNAAELADWKTTKEVTVTSHPLEPRTFAGRFVKNLIRSVSQRLDVFLTEEVYRGVQIIKEVRNFVSFPSALSQALHYNLK